MLNLKHGSMLNWFLIVMILLLIALTLPMDFALAKTRHRYLIHSKQTPSNRFKSQNLVAATNIMYQSGLYYQSGASPQL
jgi:hypothetical protein